MSEAKHTSGPWQKRDAPYGFDIVVLDKETDRALWIASVTTGLLGRESPYYPAQAECTCNAKLIEAAPDLLAALKEARTFVEGEAEQRAEQVVPSAYSRAPIVLLVQIEAAISKAEVRS